MENSRKLEILKEIKEEFIEQNYRLSSSSYMGLCGVTRYLVHNERISFSEESTIDYFIIKRAEEISVFGKFKVYKHDEHFSYLFLPRLEKPRIALLDILIKEVSILNS